MTACVVGLIIPIFPDPCSVNQRLPSGPAVIPYGPELAAGTAYSLMTCVVGLIIPIFPDPFSVNQRLPSGPAAILQGPGIAGRDGEFLDDVRSSG